MGALLDLPAAIPFRDVLAVDIPRDIRALIAEADARLSAIAAPATPRTWTDTAAAFDRATEALDRAWVVVGHLRSVAHDEALEAAHNEVLGEVSAFYAGIWLRRPLYDALRAFADTPEAAQLRGARRRWLDKTLDAFRRLGAELEGEALDRYQAIVAELAELAASFSRHVLLATQAWSLSLPDDARLGGVPEATRGMLAALAGEDGGYKVVLQGPAVTAILTYAEDRALRETVWHAWNQRGVSNDTDNRPVVARMLALRREQANLLGFDDFADFVLHDRMAHTGAEASAFVDRLETATRPAFEQENVDLARFVEAQGGPSPLMPWDVGYWSEKQRLALHDFDEEALRPYFAYDRVLDGMFTLANRLYGVTIAPTTLPGWHEDVQSFALHDADGRKLGSFYTDFFPRPTKRDGAWMNPLQTSDGRGNPHVAVICGNFTPPTGSGPALLTHREVETLFHEFGHLLHHLLTEAELYGQAGTNVAWDFVELPSQIMENWCWEREALDVFARHHETLAPIPEGLFERMIAARNFRAAAFQMRQLGFCRVDLDLHRQGTGAQDAVAYGRDVIARYSATPLPDDYAMLASFSHLFADAVGYAAGYYSYQWAAVLDADAFGVFQANGLFDRATGERFRRTILAQGDAEDPATLIARFLGRTPTVDAHLRRSGLLAA
jgi:oligopeptidase A